MQLSSFTKDLSVHYDFGIGVEVLSVGKVENESPQIAQDLDKYVGDSKIAVIGKIFVPLSLRRNGIGTSIVKGILREFNDHVTVTVARCMESSLDADIQLQSISNFFIRKGFVPLYGMMKDQREIPMLYVGNERGRLTLKRLVSDSSSVLTSFNP